MSASVHPTVQRFVLDEDCVFLLCSDGLSDYDLVDQCWQTEILPILDGSIDVATATQHLVELGNHLNGHDNITVALVHCQVKVQEPQTPVGYCQLLEKTSNGALNSTTAAVASSQTAPDDLIDNYVPIANTQILLPPLPPQQKPRHWLLPTLLGMALLLSAVGGLWLVLSKNWQQPNSAAANHNSDQSAPPGPPPAPSSSTTIANAPPRSRGIYVSKQKTTLKRQEQSANSSTDLPRLNPTGLTLPKGSIVKVLDEPKSFSGEQVTWTPLQVCSNPTPSTPSNPSSTSDRLLKPGEDAWIADPELKKWFQPTSDGGKRCSTAEPLQQSGVGNREPGAER
jgi:protein phosphatase